MGFFVRDCVRCGTRNVFHQIVGESIVRKDYNNQHELAGECADCKRLSIYEWSAPNAGNRDASAHKGNISEFHGDRLSQTPVRIATTAMELREHIPERIAGLFREANECRQMTWYEAA